MTMSETVQLVGIDLGTTTMSAVVAQAHLTRNSVTGRTGLDGIRERFRSEMVFTPIAGERIDEEAVGRQLDRWLEAGAVESDKIFGGGALLTGLTAQRDNAAALVQLIRRRLGDALIASADDPCLESWLAFMGNCAELSQAQPHLPVLNLDIGGGTTNLALGQAAEVLRTGCLFVGARHVQVEPGGYRLVRLSRYGRAVFDRVGIAKDVGTALASEEVDSILSYYMELLKAAVGGDRGRFAEPAARLHEQVAFRPLAGGMPAAITLSGGVGELVYSYLHGKPLPPTTAFGDLGIDFARRLVSSDWAHHFRRYRPASAGRATVYGLLRKNTEVSGSTLHLPDPRMLPLSDLPILGTITPASSDDELRALIDLAGRSDPGACLRVEIGSHDAGSVRAVGNRMAAILQASSFPAARTLVLLVHENVGKILGQYASRWGALPVQLVVIDEVSTRQARYARIGRPRQQVVPVTFYGLNEPGGES